MRTRVNLRVFAALCESQLLIDESRISSKTQVNAEECAEACIALGDLVF